MTTLAQVDEYMLTVYHSKRTHGTDWFGREDRFQVYHEGYFVDETGKHNYVVKATPNWPGLLVNIYELIDTLTP